MPQPDPRAAAQRKTAQMSAPRIQLTCWHGLSVAVYSDGNVHAWHNRLDLASRRTISERLPDPRRNRDDIPDWVEYLGWSYGELVLDNQRPQRLF